MKSLILMIQFLTRIPLPIEIEAETKDFEKGVVYFPVVGMLIGILIFGMTKLFVGHIDTLTLAVLLVFFEVLLTGGLHLDGLADSFDGLFSYRDRERMLEIMKDSRIGSNGVLVLIFVLLFKTVLINQILLNGLFGALLIMPVISRSMTVFASKISKYARENGMGNFFIGKVSNLQLVFSLGSTLVWIYIFSPTGLWMFLPALISTWLFTRLCSSKIGGMTGDTLGANTELQEILTLLLFVLSLRFF